MTKQIATAKFLKDLEKPVDSYKAIGNHIRDYSNLAPGQSGRPGFTYDDYYAFRPGEEPPTEWPCIFKKCNIMYRRVGLIWNVINLMTDFTIKGLRIVHPNRKKEKISQEWFRRIGGLMASERAVNYLYRLGNFVAQRYYGRIANENKLLTNAEIKEEDFKIGPDGKPPKNVIPWKYVFIDPSTVVPVGGPLAAFVDKKQYGVKLDHRLKDMIKNPKTEEERQMVAALPSDLKEAAEDASPTGMLNEGYYILKQDRTIVYSFKKDDWDTWAYPLTYPIFDDVVVLNKLKLADMSALDGASSKVRVWKLGDIQAGIAPTVAASTKLAELLSANVGGGTIDIIWDPAIELIETQQDGYNFLGDAKYKPTLNNIYSGLGVPPTLTATFGNSGTTNNYISLQTLIERLVYGRNILVDFWAKEIELFTRAMGWRQAPVLEFELPSLTDEQSQNNLLLQLADRNIISNELLQSKLGMNHNMEKIRLNREEREMEGERRVRKLSPMTNPDHSLKEIFAQTGTVTPSQVGLDLPEAQTKEITHLTKIKKAAEPPKPAGQPGQGRPKGKKDVTKRKKKTFKPKSKALLKVWADDAQERIAAILHEPLLAHFGRANLRQLTADEFESLERIKFIILASLKPFEEFTQANVIDELKKGTYSPTYFDYLKAMVKECSEGLGRTLTIEELRDLQSMVYSELAIIPE